MSIRTRAGWLARVAALCAAVVLLQGHVGITPGEVRAGTSQRFIVRVPTERTVATVRLRLEIPATLGPPRVLSKAGWRMEMENDADGRLVAIVWSGGEIGPGEFDEFEFTARVPREPGALTFKADQTYAGGEMVSWSGAPDSQAPSPVVEVRDSTWVEGGPAVAAAPADPPVTAGNGMGGAALVLATAALGLSVVALTKRA